MSQAVRIRPEQPGDEPRIHALNVACFPTAAEADLVDRLRSAGRLTMSLVAEIDGEIDGEIVGHVAFSPVSADGAIGGVGVAPVAVGERNRRQGIAAKLIEAGLAACRDGGFTWCVVLGDPHYYDRFGFRPAPAFGLRDEYGGGNAFQVLALQPGAIPVSRGLVRYAPEFSVFT